MHLRGDLVWAKQLEPERPFERRYLKLIELHNTKQFSSQ